MRSGGSGSFFGPGSQRLGFFFAPRQRDEIIRYVGKAKRKRKNHVEILSVSDPINGSAARAMRGLPCSLVKTSINIHGISPMKLHELLKRNYGRMVGENVIQQMVEQAMQDGVVEGVFSNFYPRWARNRERK